MISLVIEYCGQLDWGQFGLTAYQLHYIVALWNSSWIKLVLTWYMEIF